MTTTKTAQGRTEIRNGNRGAIISRNADGFYAVAGRYEVEGLVVEQGKGFATERGATAWATRQTAR
jgi:hypothetical protein